MTQIKHVVVPDIGDFEQVEVIEVTVSVGDTIAKDDSLLTLETDKATMEIPAPYGGVVKEIRVKKGDKISKGSEILLLEILDSMSESIEVVLDEVVSHSAVPQKQAVMVDVPTTVVMMANNNIHAGPATRRLARELGVDLAKVQGQGLRGRILTPDLKAYVKQVLKQGNGAESTAGLSVAKMPIIDFSQFGNITTEPLNRVKRKSGINLHRNWISIPHVTHFDESDITELENFRQDNKSSADAVGVRLTPLAFLLKAMVCTLKAFPQFNASLSPDGEQLIYKQYYHIGVAVDTPQGLVVPVLRDVDQKGVFQLARELDEMSARAREGKLNSQAMQGSSFTISSLGGIGGVGFTPIINAPDVAILGVSKAQIQPVYLNGEFVPRRILPFSLSYDHRVIDGAEAARFSVFFSKQLQDIRNMLL